jgi:hypothetical protein
LWFRQELEVASISGSFDAPFQVTLNVAESAFPITSDFPADATQCPENDCASDPS